MKNDISEEAFFKKLSELAKSGSIKDYVKFQQDFPNVYINLVSSEGIDMYDEALPDLPENFELGPI